MHTLRHSAAVVWLDAGVHIKAWRTGSGTALSRSPATSTGTRPMTRRWLRSTALAARLGL